MISREQFDEMAEAELRVDVLMPLFRAMNFRDVFHYHGGSLEQGKDIVMWQADPFRGRVNFAVVVKAGRISGKASGRASAGEVATQVSQCFGARYRDPVTNEERTVDRCLVVSNHVIGKEALTALGSALPADLRSRTDCIAGDVLWERVVAHLPRAALGSIERASELLDSLSPNWRLAVSAAAGQVSVRPEPKHEDAERLEPLLVEGAFAFPDTEAGRQAEADLLTHIRTGEAVTIDREFVEVHRIPNLLSGLIQLGKGAASVRLEQGGTKTPVSAQIVAVGSDGLVADLSPIDISIVRSGTDQVVWANAGQQAPWKVEATVNRRESTGNLRIQFDLQQVNVHQHLKVARFLQVASRGAHLKLLSLETGLQLATSDLVRGQIAGPEEGWVTVLEKLAQIQLKTGTPLSVPPRTVSADEVRRIFEVAEIVTSGVTTSNASWLRIPLGRSTGLNMLTNIGDGKPHSLYVRSSATETIFDTEIDLGEVYTTLEQMRLTESEITRVRAWLDDGDADAVIEVAIVPAGERSMVRSMYERWLPDALPVNTIADAMADAEKRKVIQRPADRP